MCERLFADGKSENARLCEMENRKVRAFLESNCAIVVCAECSIRVGDNSAFWQCGPNDWRRHCFTDRGILALVITTIRVPAIWTNELLYEYYYCSIVKHNIHRTEILHN